MGAVPANPSAIAAGPVALLSDCNIGRVLRRISRTTASVVLFIFAFTTLSFGFKFYPGVPHGKWAYLVQGALAVHSRVPRG